MGGGGDREGEEDVAFIAVDAEGGHVDFIGRGKEEGADGEAGGELGAELGGEAGDAGVLPVGVVAWLVADPEAEVEGLAGLDDVGVADEFDG